LLVQVWCVTPEMEAGPDRRAGGFAGFPPGRNPPGAFAALASGGECQIICDQCRQRQAMTVASPEAQLRFIFKGGCRDKQHVEHFEALAEQDQSRLLAAWQDDMRWHVLGRCTNSAQHRLKKHRICILSRTSDRADGEADGLRLRWVDQQDAQLQVRASLDRCFKRCDLESPGQPCAGAASIRGLPLRAADTAHTSYAAIVAGHSGAMVSRACSPSSAVPALPPAADRSHEQECNVYSDEAVRVAKEAVRCGRGLMHVPSSV
jgi:hypothetical protein